MCEELLVILEIFPLTVFIQMKYDNKVVSIKEKMNDEKKLLSIMSNDYVHFHFLKTLLPVLFALQHILVNHLQQCRNPEKRRKHTSITEERL